MYFGIMILMLFLCAPLQAFNLAEQDVDKALSAFNKTGKVPASVLEARYSIILNCWLLAGHNLLFFLSHSLTVAS